MLPQQLVAVRRLFAVGGERLLLRFAGRLADALEHLVDVGIARRGDLRDRLRGRGPARHLRRVVAALAVVVVELLQQVVEVDGADSRTARASRRSRDRCRGTRGRACARARGSRPRAAPPGCARGARRRRPRRPAPRRRGPRRGPRPAAAAGRASEPAPPSSSTTLTSQRTAMERMGFCGQRRSDCMTHTPLEDAERIGGPAREGCVSDHGKATRNCPCSTSRCAPLSG